MQLKKIAYGLLVGAFIGTLLFLAVSAVRAENPWPEKWMPVYELVEKYGVMQEDSPSVKGFDITWIDKENKSMEWRMMAGTGKDRIGIFLACYDIDEHEVIIGFSLYFDRVTNQYTLITPNGISEPRADAVDATLAGWLDLYRKHCPDATI